MELLLRLANLYFNQNIVNDEEDDDDDPPTYKEAIYTEAIGGTIYTEGVRRPY